MANVTLGAGRQDFVFERNGDSDRVRDFRSQYFESSLDEAQEVPPNNDIAGIEGTGTGRLDFARTRFELALAIDGIDLGGGAGQDDMTDAHIHGAEVGETGPIIFDFLNDAETEVDAAAGTITTGWDTDEDDAFDMTSGRVADLLAGDTYFNIHTNRDTSGWIRGQILKDGGAGDRIDLGELNIGSFATLKAITANQGGDAVIRTVLDGEASSLRLDGVREAELRAGHFIFADGPAETLNGGGSRDDLFGAGGGDTINGRGGNDRLFGENGADTLSGGGDRDRLVGGLGRDELTGGGQGDRFVFDDTAETGDTRRTADVITDFVDGLDLLALAGIDAREGRPGNQAFRFIDGDGFDRAGQARASEVGGDTLVALNTTGRGGAEAVIRLEDVVGLTEDSLIL
jgi:Ca2+-binding RTX toxin-like protein